jgi:hypothetical protein
MATTVDLSGNYPPSMPTGVDNPLSKPNRQNAGSPVGSLTPAFSGELVFDTTNRMLFTATGVSNTSWMPVVVAVQ